MITIELDDRKVQDVLQVLLARVENMQPAMQEIGDYLVHTTKQRFESSRSPDGTPWQRNSQTTYVRMLDRSAKVTNKDGKINAKGTRLAIGKKPLIGETHRLSSEIYAVPSRSGVLIGSPLEYAATQQFGAKRGAFGKTKRGGPIPWGDIPARPFIGLSQTDDDNVLEIVQDYLAEAIQ